jgi:hypothetical protein
MAERANSLNRGARNILTNVASRLHDRTMPREIDILNGLLSQFELDAREIQDINIELNDLRPKFQKYNELTSRLIALEDRAKLSYVMLYPSIDWKNDAKQPPPEVLGITFETDMLKEKAALSLWRVIREIVRQGTKIRIVQLQDLLASLGHSASRQSIESALATHKKIFRITKSGREKFVSLK